MSETNFVDVGAPQGSTASTPSMRGPINPDAVAGVKTVNIQVGSSRFVTKSETLTKKSGYFASLIDNNTANNPNSQGLADRPLFVDADPELFVQILRYLRTSSFPLFFDSTTLTFDIARYKALLDEARFLEISELVTWITERKYVDMVKIRHESEVKSYVIPAGGIDVGMLQASGLSSLTYLGGFRPEATDIFSADTKVQYKIAYGTRKVYICPRSIQVHRGNPGMCGQQCKKAQMGEAPMFEDEPHGVLVRLTHKTTVEIDDEGGAGDE